MLTKPFLHSTPELETLTRAHQPTIWPHANTIHLSAAMSTMAMMVYLRCKETGRDAQTLELVRHANARVLLHCVTRTLILKANPKFRNTRNGKHSRWNGYTCTHVAHGQTKKNTRTHAIHLIATNHTLYTETHTRRDIISKPNSIYTLTQTIYKTNPFAFARHSRTWKSDGCSQPNRDTRSPYNSSFLSFFHLVFSIVCVKT